MKPQNASDDRTNASPSVMSLAPLLLAPLGSLSAAETEPAPLQRVVAVENVCAWPNLTLLGDGTVTAHEPETIRMNHAAGLARNGDLIVLCSGWTNVKQPDRPKQGAFRDAVLRPWVLRSADGGRTWENRDAFPAPESGWTEYVPFGDIWPGEDGALHTSCCHAQVTDPSQPPPAPTERGARPRKTRAMHSWHFRSDDDGVTWQAPQPVTERNEINGHLNRLKDGRLLLSYGVRVSGRRGVCAKLSADDGRTWGEPLRLAHTVGDADCGYPSSVQLPSGAIVTAWYSKETSDHVGYHMGVTVWNPPPTIRRTANEPVQPDEFRHARITDAWRAYAGVLTFGRGQTLALVDDGCTMSMPEWTASVDGVPKVRVTYDAVDGDSDPNHEGRGYHGSTIGVPSSLNFQGKWGVAYNNQVAVIRGLECCHGKVADSRTLAAALQWILDNHEKHRITTVNLAPVDDKAHAEPLPTKLDSKLAELRKRHVWVSAPSGNHNFTTGISWPACQPDCFAIGAVKTGKDEVYLDRNEKVVLLVPAKATSSSNAIVCGAAMLLREAIEKTGYDWKADGTTLPDAMMAIFQKTGPAVDDPATKRSYRRLDALAALEYVFARTRE